MTNRNMRCSVILTMLLAGMAQSIGAAPTVTSADAKVTALPSDSVYQLATPLTDQTGHKFTIGDRRGTPTIVSMFYTSCQFVCPMLVEAIRANQQKLPVQDRPRVNVLLVTFDPKHDTVDVLHKTAQQRELDGATWTLARTDATSVRKLAATLGIQYKAMPNGDYNHSTTLVLLDADGRVVGRTTQISDADPAFVAQIKATLASANH